MTWTARESNREWISIASSADGSKLVAADYGGQIYTSTDFGLTWTVQVGSGFHFWYSIASSADGNKLAAVDNGGLIYTSTDLGVTWTAQASGSRSWVSIASSADGNKLAAVNDGGQIYTSTDSGVTWTARENNHNWTSITSSTDGDKLAAVDNSGQIYTSVGSTLPYIITVPANSGLYTVSSFATNILAGPPDEATQTVSFTVTNDNNAIFSVSPTIAANGTLSFSPSALPGTAIITVVAQDNGGKANGGADTSAPQTFTITITNNAPVANDDFAVTSVNTPVTINATANDTDPNGDSLTIVSVSPTNGTASIVNGTKVLFTPNINFNGTATIGYTVSDGNGGTASALITVSISAVADVAVKKSGPANVYAGTNFDYTITVTNLGASTASSLSVTDDLPAGVTFMSSTAGATVNGSQVVWTNLGDLATGSSTNLIITVTAPANGTSLTNVASGRSPTADPNPTNNVTPPVVTTVTSVADVSVTKNAQTAAVLPGAAFDYTITVSNAGPSTASSVTVTDDLPANVTFVSASGRRTSRSS